MTENGWSKHEVDIENRLRRLEDALDGEEGVWNRLSDHSVELGKIMLWQKIIGGVNAAIGLAALGLLFRLMEHGLR